MVRQDLGTSKNHCHLKYIPRLEKTSETSNSLWRTVSYSLYLLQPVSHRSCNDYNRLWELRVTNTAEGDEKLWIVNSTESLGGKLVKKKQLLVGFFFVSLTPLTLSNKAAGKSRNSKHWFHQPACCAPQGFLLLFIGWQSPVHLAVQPCSSTSQGKIPGCVWLKRKRVQPAQLCHQFSRRHKRMWRYTLQP